MPSRASKTHDDPSPLFNLPFRVLPAPAPGAGRPLPAEVRDIADRVRCEFVEMRGFSPTVEQAARLFQISRQECEAVLESLVAGGFLKRTSDGRYRLPSQL